MPGSPYVAAAGGRSHTVLLRSDGSAVACGQNRHGQCDMPASPTEDGGHYVAAAAADFQTVFLRSDGQAEIFGDSPGGFVAGGGPPPARVPWELLRFAVPHGLPERLHHRVVWKLSRRSMSVDDLLRFWHEHALRKFDEDASFMVTTRDIVKEIIVPVTARARCSWADEFKKIATGVPVTYVVHTWEMRFYDLLWAILANANTMRSPRLTTNYNENRQWHEHVLEKRYWLCCFCVNQHNGPCKELWCNCTCDAPVIPDGVPESETNKFEDVIHQLHGSNDKSLVLLTLDRELHVFRRVWCLDEVHFALVNKMQIRQSFSDNFGVYPGINALREFHCYVELARGRQVDKERIMRKIEASVGVPAFDKRITAYASDIVDQLVKDSMRRQIHNTDRLDI
eukprot:TRINITY_DN28899_c0_g1_i1.p1 TRINITY_DN28899_c0_g1~~TRINITY_DN28899_c0_g1_i1.p1  ORF type:complete len:464 (+),score=88.80 TRINITY_DN28899_c0_g1_i1:205-1392(+)